ncbi:golgin subfamily A member 4-like isoform X2 [Onthophagus taurus]|uniref:golgin subfamily A member 4-like isoform X2 n=1 Tax=Onthophagus taurus TaxID=166361 RepID=UPI0039BE1DDD
MKSIKAIFRRGGQQNAQKHQNSEENVSRTSSVTNLAETKGSKTASGGGNLSKSKRSGSKDRLEKAQSEIKKKIPKNEMNLNENDQEINQNHQESVNKPLEGVKMDQKPILDTLENELKVLKENFNKISDENLVLRTRLKDVSHSPLSDNEKQQLLTLNDGLNLLKSEEKSMDQNEIFSLKETQKKMQETLFCTNEELQATLQELNDLQKQLTDLQQDNDQLIDEKNLMFDSLCRQTERLNETKNELEGIKTVFNQKINQKHEKEIKNDDLTSKLEKLTEKFELNQKELENNKTYQNELQNQLKLLENELKSKEIDNLNLKLQHNLKLEEIERKSNEIVQLKHLLTTYSTKIDELQQQNQTEIEKKSIENSIENEKLKNQIGNLQSQLEKLQNNSKLTQNELQIELGNLKIERNELSDELRSIKSEMKLLRNELEKEMEEKNRVSIDLNETKRMLNDLELRNEKITIELDDLKKIRKDENEEWERFQNDLLTSVRVANDFKTEAQQDLQKIVSENKAYREKVCQLEVMVEKLSGDPSLANSTSSGNFVENVNENEEIARSSSKIEDFSESGFPQPEEIIQLKQDNSLNDEIKESNESKPKINKHFIKKPKIFRASKGYHFVQDDEKPQKDVVVKEVVAAKSFPVREVLQEAKESQENKKKMFSVPKIGRKIDQNDKNLITLNNLYREIDPTIPEEDLTQEQRVIIQLKRSYDLNSNQKNKKKINLGGSRSNLVISRPLLNSVFQNRKLKEVIDDPTMKSVDDGENILFGAPNVFYPTNFDDVYRNNIEFKYYNEDKNQKKVLTTFKSDSFLSKSKSLNDLTVKNEEFGIKRQLSESVLSRSDDEDSFSSFNDEGEDLDEIYKEIKMQKKDEGVFEEKKKEIEKKNEDLLQNKVLVKKSVKKNLIISAPIQESILNDEKLLKIAQDESIKSLSPPKKSSMFVKIKSKLPKKIEIERCYVYDHDEVSVIDGKSINKNDSIPPTETFNTYLKNKLENELDTRKSVEVQTDENLLSKGIDLKKNFLDDLKTTIHEEIDKNDEFEDQVKIKSLIEKSGRLNSLKRKEELEIMYQLMRPSEKSSRSGQGQITKSEKLVENGVKIEEDFNKMNVKIDVYEEKIENDGVKIELINDDELKIVDEVKKIGSKNVESPMVMGPSFIFNFITIKSILNEFLNEERKCSNQNLMYRKNSPQINYSSSILSKRRTRNLRKPTGIDLEFDFEPDENDVKLSRNSSFKSTISQDSNEDEIIKNISAKLDDDEVEVVKTLRRKYKVRERPKSEINEDDLKLIEEAKKKCLSPEYQDEEEVWGKNNKNECFEENYDDFGELPRDIGRLPENVSQLVWEFNEIEGFKRDVNKGDEKSHFYDEKMGKLPRDLGKLPVTVNQLPGEMTENENFKEKGQEIKEFEENREKIRELPPSVDRLPQQMKEIKGFKRDVDDKGDESSEFYDDFDEKIGKLPRDLGRLPENVSQLAWNFNEIEGFKRDVNDKGDEKSQFYDDFDENLKKTGKLPQNVGRLPENVSQLPWEMNKIGGFKRDIDDKGDEKSQFCDDLDEDLEKIGKLPRDLGRLPENVSQLAWNFNEIEGFKRDVNDKGDEKSQFYDDFDENLKKTGKLPQNVGRLPENVSQLPWEMNKIGGFKRDIDDKGDEKSQFCDDLDEDLEKIGKLPRDLGRLPENVSQLAWNFNEIEGFKRDVNDKGDEKSQFYDDFDENLKKTGKLPQNVGRLPENVSQLPWEMNKIGGFKRDIDDKGDEKSQFCDDLDEDLEKIGKLPRDLGRLPVAVNQLSRQINKNDNFNDIVDKGQEINQIVENPTDNFEKTGELPENVSQLPREINKIGGLKRDVDDKGDERSHFCDDLDENLEKIGKLPQNVGRLPVAVNQLSRQMNIDDNFNDIVDKGQEINQIVENPADNFEKTGELPENVSQLPREINKIGGLKRDVDDKGDEKSHFCDDLDENTGKLSQNVGRLPVAVNQLSRQMNINDSFNDIVDKGQEINQIVENPADYLGKTGELPENVSQLPQQMKEIEGFKRNVDDKGDEKSHFCDDLDKNLEKIGKLPQNVGRLPVAVNQLSRQVNTNDSFNDIVDNGQEINQIVENPADYLEKTCELPETVSQLPQQKKEIEGFKRNVDDKGDEKSHFCDDLHKNLEKIGKLPLDLGRLPVAVNQLSRQVNTNDSFNDIVDNGQEINQIVENPADYLEKTCELPETVSQLPQQKKEIEGFKRNVDDKGDERSHFYDDLDENLEKTGKLPLDLGRLPVAVNQLSRQVNENDNFNDFVDKGQEINQIVENPVDYLEKTCELPETVSQLPQQMKDIEGFKRNVDDKGDEKSHFYDDLDENLEKFGKLPQNVGRLPPNVNRLPSNVNRLPRQMNENENFIKDVHKGQEINQFLENPDDYLEKTDGLPKIVSRLPQQMKKIEGFKRDEKRQCYEDFDANLEKTGKLPRDLGRLPVAVNQLPGQMTENEDFKEKVVDKGQEINQFFENHEKIRELPIAINRLPQQMKEIEGFKRDVDDKGDEKSQFYEDLDENTGKLSQNVGRLPVAVNQLSPQMNKSDNFNDIVDKGQEINQIVENPADYLEKTGEPPPVVNELPRQIDENESVKQKTLDKGNENSQFPDNRDDYREEIGKLPQDLGRLPENVSQLSSEINEIEDFKRDLDDKGGEKSQFYDDFDEKIENTGKLPQDLGRLPENVSQLPSEMNEIEDFKRDLDDKGGEKSEFYDDFDEKIGKLPRNVNRLPVQNNENEIFKRNVDDKQVSSTFHDDSDENFEEIGEVPPDLGRLPPGVNQLPREINKIESFEGDVDDREHEIIQFVEPADDYQGENGRLPPDVNQLPRQISEIKSFELKIDNKEDEMKQNPQKHDDYFGKVGKLPKDFSQLPGDMDKSKQSNEFLEIDVDYRGNIGKSDHKINLELYQPKPYQRRSFENLNSTWRNQKTGEILEKKKISKPISPNRYSFQQISLDTSNFYEPIYENFSIFQQKRPNSVNFDSNLSKTPVPQPRKDLSKDNEKNDVEVFDELSLEKTTFDDVKSIEKDLIREESRKMSVNQEENEGKFDVEMIDDDDDDGIEKNEEINTKMDEIKVEANTKSDDGDKFDHLDNLLENLEKLKEMRRKANKKDQEIVEENLSENIENKIEEPPKTEVVMLRKSEEKILTPPVKEIRASKSPNKNITKDRVSLLRQKFEGKSDDNDSNSDKHQKEKVILNKFESKHDSAKLLNYAKNDPNIVCANSQSIDPNLEAKNYESLENLRNSSRINFESARNVFEGNDKNK